MKVLPCGSVADVIQGRSCLGIMGIVTSACFFSVSAVMFISQRENPSLKEGCD